MADRWLRPTLAALMGLTGASCLQVAFVPLGPTASLGPPPGPITGFIASPLPPRPGRNGRDRSVSASERQSLRPADGNGARIELSRTALAVRRPKELQLAALTAADPALALQRRRLLQLGDDQVAIGRLGDQVALQGCLTASGTSGITAAALRTSTPPAPKHLGERLSRLVGLSPNSFYGCTLVSLTTAATPGAEHRLLSLWNLLQQRRPQGRQPSQRQALAR